MLPTEARKTGHDEVGVCVCVCARALLSTHTHARLVDSVISFPGTGEQEVGSDRYSDMNVFHFIGVRVCF